VLLDQRGTGRSAPVGAAALAGRTPQEQAAHLTHFRADAIVRDAEALRAALGSPPWSVLGQSFGGFTTLTYLSLAPEGLREALFTGGLPPIGRHPDEVYRATFARVQERCRRYYERYPEDRARVVAAAELAPVLASGDRLSHARLRQAGNLLGMSDGAEQLHGILELPPGSPAFAHDIEVLDFAQRTLPEAYADDPALLTGEHVFPWMFEELGALRPSARPPSCSPSTRGRACTTRRSWPATPCRPLRRSTRTTSTSSAPSRRRRRRPCAACGPG
jgi:pimeloyl-ACP methyl ester carboxylesterase